MAAGSEKRQVVRYAFYKLDPAWRRLTAERQATAKIEFGETLERYHGRLLLRPYGLVGIRGDTDFLLWQVSEDLDALVELQTALNRTDLGGYLAIPYSYLAMTRRSIYEFPAPATPDQAHEQRLVIQPSAAPETHRRLHARRCGGRAASRQCQTRVRRQRGRRALQRERHHLRERQPLHACPCQPVGRHGGRRPLRRDLSLARRCILAGDRPRPRRPARASRRGLSGEAGRRHHSHRSRGSGACGFLKRAVGSAPTSLESGSCGRRDATCRSTASSVSAIPFSTSVTVPSSPPRSRSSRSSAWASMPPLCSPTSCCRSSRCGWAWAFRRERDRTSIVPSATPPMSNGFRRSTSTRSSDMSWTRFGWRAARCPWTCRSSDSPVPPLRWRATRSRGEPVGHSPRPSASCTRHQTPGTCS